MCGIAGILGLSAERATALADSLHAAMRHRGPDDRGTELIRTPDGPPSLLVHARLSILDLSPAGHQPMCDRPADPAQSPNWVVFNGEIYNFLELHAELAAAGWPCRTRCDTEVILHAYRVWGLQAVERFRGMFAFCLLDTANRRAWLCRDRLGIKPLYLADLPGGGLAFASEFRTLLALPSDLLGRAVRPEALESFFAQGCVCGDQSLLEQVRMLGAGCSLVRPLSGGRPVVQPYWQLPASAWKDPPMQRADAVEQIAGTLRTAVRQHLISDVPWGLFLSGGVDSSALATVAREVAESEVRAITVGFDVKEFDETDYATQIARSLGLQQHCVQLSGEQMLREIDLALGAMDSPTVDGINTYFVSRAARQAGVTVALSGLGGDELFGGYATFYDVPAAVRLVRGMRWLRRLNWLFAPMVGAAGGRRGAKTAELLRRDPAVLQMYLLRRELFLPHHRRALQLLPPGSDALSGVPSELLSAFAPQVERLDAVNGISLLELSLYMRHMLLRDTDAFSMAHGLEIRVPLIDHVLVEQAFALNGAWKADGPPSKRLLIDAVGANLPTVSYSRPKAGFTIPWADWLLGPMSARVADAVHNRGLWTRLGLEPGAVERIWRRFTAKDQRISGLQLLAVIVLEDFARRHGLG